MLERKKMVFIDKRKIGDGEPCFITFEAGATHDGAENAKKLVQLASESGADAIKFQIFDPDRLIADKKMHFSYDILVDRKSGTTETISEPLYDILCRRYLDAFQWKDIKMLCDKLGIAFFATIGFEEDIKILESLNTHSIKIASADINHWPLIKSAARTGMCIQLDTGNAKIGEIEEAVDIIKSEGNEKIIIHNCPSGYPARLESINLNLIPTLKRIFPYPIAFSDHSPGWEMDIAAISMGANLVEKTITLDRTTRGPEHIFSLENEEIKRFICSIRDLEIALGNSRRILHNDELKQRKKIRRSAFLKENVEKGRHISEVKIEFRRPGLGIGPNIFENLQEYKINKALPAGHMLTISDLE